MGFESQFRMNAKQEIIDHIYKYSIRILENDYKKLIKEHLSLEGEDPEDLAIHYVCLDTRYVWLGGRFQEELYYGLKPVYINHNIRDKLYALNHKRKEILKEQEVVSGYLAKVLTEAKTIKDIHTYLPPAVHNVAEFKSIYEQGDLTENESLEKISDKYMAIMNERMILNLLVKE